MGLILSKLLLTMCHVMSMTNHINQESGMKYGRIYLYVIYKYMISSKYSFTCVTGPTPNGSYGIVTKISYLVDRIMSEDTVKFSYKV